MGFIPQDVGRMSVWKYLAALDGYIAANSTDEDKSLTESEKDELAEWLGI
ncbi:hypothetical protein KYK29_05110 [Shinella daejeonensis]|nr:hypothetical protein [Shinella daejeonensis]